MPVESQPRIIEIAAILWDTNTGDQETVLDTLVNPGIDIPPEITKITGIRGIHVKGKPAWSELELDNFHNLLASADVITGHNLRFDLTLVEYEARRMGKALELSDGDLICTVEQTEFVKGFRLKLQSLYEHLTGNKNVQTHRALDDVKMQLECFRLLASDGYLPHLGITE